MNYYRVFPEYIKWGKKKQIKKICTNYTTICGRNIYIKNKKIKISKN